MGSFTKNEKESLKEILSGSKHKQAKKILDKIKREQIHKYVSNPKEIIRLLKKAYEQKKKVKIKYYSHMSDEVTWRKISIYRWHKDCIIAYCHMRNDERVFRTDRVYKATLLDESSEFPKDWKPENIVYSK